MISRWKRKLVLRLYNNKDMTQVGIKSTNTNKAAYINQMFNNIAPNYDLLNNLMTFGFHKKWKKEALKLALKEASDPKEALDLCSGTGDLAIILSKLIPSLNIICGDNSANMLDIAKQRIEKLGLKNISTSLIDCENLPFKASTFDLITIGFGLRNLINREKCIEDFYNILKTNGVFMSIDLGYPNNFFWQKMFFSYFFNIVPLLGQIFAKDKSAYSYLPDSLKSWYKQEELKSILLLKGFRKCYFKNILGGVVAIHIAVK